MDNPDLRKQIKQLLKRVEKLEKVSHKQPDMKQMMSTAVEIYRETNKNGRVSKKTSGRRSCGGVKRC